MRDFLKDKPKEEFPKAPSMPEDMREMYRQRQRELQLERAQMSVADETEDTEEGTTTQPSAITTPKLEDTTLPPAPKQDQPAEPRTDPAPKPQTPPAEAPRQETRPREAEPAKKKGRRANRTVPNSRMKAEG